MSDLRQEKKGVRVYFFEIEAFGDSHGEIDSDPLFLAPLFPQGGAGS